MFELPFFKTAGKRKVIFSSQTQKISSSRRFFSALRERKIIEDFKPPKLHILDNVAKSLLHEENNVLDMSNTAIIGVQHMLSSTASLFDAINKHLKVSKKNMFFSGKFYSSCPEVEDYIRKSGIQLMPTKAPKKHGMYEEHIEEAVSNMWEKFIEHLEKNKNINKIIVLDEGGHCTRMMPKYIPCEYEIAAIEQTRFGLYDKDIDSHIFPLIDVARSAAKRKLESPLIAAAITARVSEVMKILGVDKNKVCGVIGNGAIGSAVTKYILSQGHKVIVYDENNDAFQDIHNNFFYRVDSIRNVIASSDIVFGCTGKDITKKSDILKFFNGSTTLVSCSSQNIEFLSLLKKATQDDYLIQSIDKNLSQLKYVVCRGKEINILENGFPINFDRRQNSVPVKDIELTRCLLFCSVIQAFFSAKKPVNDGRTLNNSSIQILDPYMQRLIVKKWIKNQPQHRYSEQAIDCFNDVQWIIGNSGGDYTENDYIISRLNQTDSGKQTENKF